MGKLLPTLEKHLCALCPPALSMLHCSGTPTFSAAQPGHLADPLENLLGLSARNGGRRNVLHHRRGWKGHLKDI